jgi:hypothetical protein
MKLKIKASAVNMSCDQWAYLINVCDKDQIIVRSENRQTDWTIRYVDIIGVELNDELHLSFRVHAATTKKAWSKT